jgi:cysteine desulfurase
MSDDAGRVYLDHNATSPVRPEAVRAVTEVMEGSAANPSSLHAEGQRARAVLEDAREKVAALAGVAANDLVFTSGGSEAITAAIRGVCDRAPRGRKRIVVSLVEHSAVLEAARAAMRWGIAVEHVRCDRDGRTRPDEFASKLDRTVCLAALQWANNETGVIQPVEEVGSVCARHDVPFLVDAVQAAGKITLDPGRARASLLALSGHKLGGPQGTGALVVEKGLDLAPLIAGGAQERRRRGGTEAVAAAAGFGAAADAAAMSMTEEARRLLRLRARIETRLRDLFPNARIHGEGAPRLPNTVNFGLPGVPGEMLAIAMDVAGFALSTGSACASGSVKPSHVIQAIGCDDEEARGAVRVSLGWSTTPRDVDRFLETLPVVVEQVRQGIEA